MKFPIRFHRLSGCAAVVLALLRFSAAAAPGDADLHFNPLATNDPPPGCVLESFEQGPAFLTKLFPLPDGRIAGAGYAGSNLMLVCWLPDGSRDPGFGNGGGVSIPNTGGKYLTGITMQENGRLVVAHVDIEGVALRRFLPNGAPDPEFGSGGTLTPVTGERGAFYALIPLSSGKMLAVGSAFFSGEYRPKLWRLLPDGSVDPAFGTGGGTSLSLKGSFESVALQPDGKIVAAGTGQQTSEDRSTIARFHADGTLDDSFGTLGSVALPSLRGPSGFHLALTEDGRILFDSVTAGASRVSRLLPDGSADPSFGTGGYVEFPASNKPFGLVVQPGGNVIVGTGSMTGDDFSLVRLLADGRPDEHFGTRGNGTAQFDLLYGSSYAYCVAMQPDGRVLVGGDFRKTNAPDQMALVRFHTRTLTDSLSAERPAGTPLPYGSILSWPVVRGIPGTAESTITLRNKGPAPLTNLSTRFTGTGSDHFALLSTLPPVLNSGDTATLTVRFLRDQQVAAFGAALVIESGNPDIENFVIVLHGSVAAPVATLKLLNGAQPLTANDDLEFGTTTGTKPLTRTLTLQNTGNIELEIEAISLAPSGTPDDFTAGPPEKDRLLPGESTTFPVTFTPSAPGARTARLRIASTDTFSPPLEIDLMGSGASGLDGWRLTHFDTLLNEGPAADLSDPDGDGIPNLLEYATLSSPVQPGSPSGELSMEGNTLKYSFTRPSSAALDLHYRLEFTDSLESQWLTGPDEPAIIEDDGTRQRVLFSLSAGTQGHRFVRLRIFKE